MSQVQILYEFLGLGAHLFWIILCHWLFLFLVFMSILRPVRFFEWSLTLLDLFLKGLQKRDFKRFTGL